VVSAVVVEARGVVHDYPGPLRALQGADLELRAGELLVVIGPNGSGKSTLLRCLAGLLRPSAGRVLLEGRPLRALRPRERARRIAVVPQYLPALPDLTVESFALGGRYAWLEPWRGPQVHDVEVVREALQDCDAGDLDQRLVGELSGGQRQRVLIARALAQEARALLVDEPTTSLDPEHQVRVFALLERLVRAGRAALVVTHDLNLASQFAHRIALVDGGRVVATGGVEDVLRRDVLEPVYGPHLYYGRASGPSGGGRPFVLPWLDAGEDAMDG
jgi:iron complex transport system ATP-binding protein